MMISAQYVAGLELRIRELESERCALHTRFVGYEDESIVYINKIGDMVMQGEDEPLEDAIQRMIDEREEYRDNAIKAETELAALKADDNLTVAYMSGFHDGKKAALKAGQGEPVGVVKRNGLGFPYVDLLGKNGAQYFGLEDGTPLYTSTPTIPEEYAEVIAAATALVERWETPLWKDVPHTGEYINRLRLAIAAAPKPEE